MEKRIQGTGIYEGLSLPPSCRGKFVLVADGKVLRCSASARDLVKAAARLKGSPAIFAVPDDDAAVAAY